MSNGYRYIKEIFIMGEIADGMIDGTFDYITGEYLGEGGGFPRSYADNHSRGCYSKPGKHGKKKGIVKYLLGFDIEKLQYHTHCLAFIQENDLLEKGKGTSWEVVSDVIQDNWQKFVQYIDKHHKRKAKPQNRAERRKHLQKK